LGGAARRREIEFVNSQLPRDAKPLTSADQLARELDGYSRGGSSTDIPKLRSSVRLPRFHPAPHENLYFWPRATT
jgi:hypothetical protein